jgi:hypothetical protein
MGVSCGLASAAWAADRAAPAVAGRKGWTSTRLCSNAAVNSSTIRDSFSPLARSRMDIPSETSGKAARLKQSKEA